MNERLVIDPSGVAFVERTELIPVSGVPKMLGTLTEDLCVRLPNLTPDSWMVLSNGAFTYFKLINELKLNTTWTIDKDRNVAHPEFRNVDASEFQVMLDTSALSWTTPADMALLFIASNLQSTGKLMTPGKGARQPSVELREQPCVLGLVAVDLNTGKVYKLPLPNTYDDGTLCPGELEYSRGFPITMGMGVYGSWSLNRWNSDLISSTSNRYRKLINLDPKTSKTIDVPWQPLCDQISIDGWLNSKIFELGTSFLTK